MKLSQNFDSSEFACQCGTCLASTDPPMEVAFIMKLQKMRNLYAKPMHITSGYRCKKHNTAIWGAPASKHMEGIAADIRCDNAQEKFWMLRYALEVGFSGIGIARNFIHVDTREGAPVVWTY